MPAAAPGWWATGDLRRSVVGANHCRVALRLSSGESRATLASRRALCALHDKVFARRGLKRYVSSERRIAFNNDDVFLALSGARPVKGGPRVDVQASNALQTLVSWAKGAWAPSARVEACSVACSGSQVNGRCMAWPTL